MERAKKELQKYGLIYLTIVVVFFANVVWGMSFATRPSYVYDWEGILTDEELQEINNFCAEVDANTTVEIVTITLKSFDEPLKVGDIDEARVKYFNDYPLDGVTGIGKSGEDSGILIIFSLAEGYWGIEIGYGLEGDLTDSESGRIGRDILLENLKDEMPGAAVLRTCEAIAKEIGYGQQEEVISSEDDTDSLNVSYSPYIVPVLVGVVLIVISVFVIKGVRKAGADKEKRRRSYIDDEIGKLKDHLTSVRLAQSRAIQEQDRAIQKLKPKPIIIAKCPTCQADRRSEVLNRGPKEILEGDWYWSFIVWGLLCLTCGSTFKEERERKKGESFKGREVRLKKEREERKRQEKERRRREEERRRREEEEARRRRRRQAERSRISSSSRSSSRSSFSDGFGGGRSGGAGSSGRIR